MPTYALQWCAMQTARRAGCSEYDLFGVAPNADPSHPMHGLYRFKTGFGGQIFHIFLDGFHLAHDGVFHVHAAAHQIGGQGFEIELAAGDYA